MILSSLWRSFQTQFDHKSYTAMSAKKEASVINHLLQLDAHYSRMLYISEDVVGAKALHQCRRLFRALEWSCHGVPWLVAAIAGIAVGHVMSLHGLFTYCVVLLAYLLLDLVVIASFKLFARRPRPCYNAGDMPLSASKVDQFSFPSGHCTRAFMLLTFFLRDVTSPLYVVGLVGMAVAVGLSRVMLGRHYVLDVMAGMCIGVVVGSVPLANILGLNH